MKKTWTQIFGVACVSGVFAWFLVESPEVVSLQAAGSCEALSSLTLQGGTVTLAQPVTAGGFAPSVTGNAQGAAARLQPFCRVAVTLKPSSDSDIRMELWMPASNWNGRFQAVGNGAFNGNINYAAMMTALARGYAVSSTDTGHTGGARAGAWAIRRR